MSKRKGIISGAKDFGRGLRVLVGNKPFSGGDKTLAAGANMLRSLIPMAGIGVVRKQLINEIESHLKKEVKKDPVTTVDKLLATSLGTPEYMALLKDLELGEKDLRFFAEQALQKGKKHD